MLHVRRILVPTDFSEAADHALTYAVGLAEQFGAEILLMHTVEIPVYAYPGAPYIPVVDITADLEKAAVAGLEATRARMKSPVHARVALRRGSPWREILDAAKEERADLVVMGTHGRRGVARALLGSVAEKVVRAAEVPVLTVRQTFAEQAHERSRGDVDVGAGTHATS